MHFSTLLAGCTLCALSTAPAFAASASWDTPLAGFNGTGTSAASPWAAGDAYAEWNLFDSVTTDATPDIAGHGSVRQLNPSAGTFLTGSGNLYSSAGAAAFSVELESVAAGTWSVWLRIATQGTAADSQAFLNGLAATKTVSYSTTLGGFGGSEEEAWWNWILTDPASLHFSFSSSAPHMSLDQLAVLTIPVPEPHAWMSLAMGLGVLRLARRQTRKG